MQQEQNSSTLLQNIAAYKPKSRKYLPQFLRPARFSEEIRDKHARFFRVLELAKVRVCLDNKATPKNALKVKINREMRRKMIEDNPDFQEFFDWIIEIKETLGLNRAQFAELLGVNRRTLEFYINKTGVFPSVKILKRLFELERACTIKVNVIEDNISFCSNEARIELEI
jgi:DNA-binding XRE family transcriptional regulator